MILWTAIEPVPGTTLAIWTNDHGITRITFGYHADGENAQRDDMHPLLTDAVRQLRAYYSGALREFNLPLDLTGTPFQLRVWQALQTIPYGRTISYGQLALAVGSPRALRAVGAANGANPVPIVIPCHRVIQTGGALGGFSSGLDYKRRLLELESGQSTWL